MSLRAAARLRPSTAAIAAVLGGLALAAGCERMRLDLGDRRDAGSVGQLDAGPEEPLIFVREIALGSDFACALLTDGFIACWGSDSHGQLGIDPSLSIAPDCGGRICSPRPIRNERLGHVDTMGAGDSFLCARSTLGAASCIGSNRFGELGGSLRPDPDRHFDPVYVFPGDGQALEIAVGRHHACAIGPDRRVRCWGLAEHGQLGRAGTERCEVPPGMHAELGVPEAMREVACSSAPALVEGLEEVDHVVAGDFHTCALAAGAVTCWGRDDRGQLGDGTPGGSRATPSPVAAPSGPITSVRMLALGGGTSIALQSAGTSARWGDASHGALGFAPDDAELCGQARCAPTPRVEPWHLTSVALGQGFGCGLDAVGQALCWGLATEGRLGTTSSPRSTCATEAGEVPCALEPIPLPGLGRGVRAIAVGDAHACALVYVGGDEDGSVRCWGRNDRGQLGLGRAGGEGAVPVAIPGTR